MILVTPSELVNLYFYAARPTDGQLLRAAIVVTNALQMANVSFNFVLYLVVNAQFRAAVTETCRCPGLLSPCCRRPLTMTTDLLELGCPLTVATAAAAGGSVAVEPATGTASASQEGRREQTFGRVSVEVNRTEQTVAWRRRDVAVDDEQHTDQR